MSFHSCSYACESQKLASLWSLSSREPIVRKCRPLPSGNGFVQVIHKVDALTDEDLGERGDAAHVNGHHLDGPKPD
jgi:hypothetical protein